MIGLMVLIFFAVYLLISIWITRKTASWAKANNKKPWIWGGVAAFMMYNLVFWDLIPTLIVHKHYCDTQAGFLVYKTPKQWKAENPDLIPLDLETFGKKIYVGKEELVWSFPYQPLENNPKQSATMINKRIYLGGDIDWNFSKVIAIRKNISFIADTKNDEKLAQQVTFGSGYGNPMVVADWRAWKFWLAKSTCNDKIGEHTIEYDAFIEELISLGMKNG